LNNNKLINPKLICAFCWFVLFFNYENARSKNQNRRICLRLPKFLQVFYVNYGMVPKMGGGGTLRIRPV